MAAKSEHRPMGTEPKAIEYPPNMDKDKKKLFKMDLLRRNPETLYKDIFGTGKRCNLIFHTNRGGAWRTVVRAHYPRDKDKKDREIKDGYQLWTEGGNVNVYSTGTVMVQGTEEFLDTFQRDFPTLTEDLLPLLLEKVAIRGEDEEEGKKEEEKEEGEVKEEEVKEEEGVKEEGVERGAVGVNVRGGKI